MSRPNAQTIWTLEPHEATSQGPVSRISGTSERTQPGSLLISYKMEGQISEVRLPLAGPITRGHDLWQHTCFEAFMRARHTQSYFEFNFAPSREWAAYQFSSYREGMRSVEGLDPPKITVGSQESGLVLSVAIDLSAVGSLLEAEVWEVGLAAIVESRSGEQAYWALAHPPGKPDFHHSDCFVQQLTVSDST